MISIKNIITHIVSIVNKIYDFIDNTHNDHKIIFYEQIMTNKNDIKIKLEELQKKIDVFENNIKDIIKILNKIVQNIKLYYKIKNNIFQNLDNKNRNFESLCNLINITKDDYAIRDMIEENVCNKFNYIFKLYQKINIKNNDDLNINEYSYEYEKKINILSPGEYKSKLKFCVNGNNIGEILTIKIKIKIKAKYKIKDKEKIY